MQISERKFVGCRAIAAETGAGPAPAHKNIIFHPKSHHIAEKKGQTQ
jgi:hypothetical protein